MTETFKLMLICVHKLRKARHDIPATVLVCNGLFVGFLMWIKTKNIQCKPGSTKRVQGKSVNSVSSLKMLSYEPDV